MIVTFVLNFFYNLLVYLANVLPTGFLPQGINDAINYFWGALNAFSYVFPVVTLLEALSVVLVFDAAVLFWHIFQWILMKIPGMQ